MENTTPIIVDDKIKLLRERCRAQQIEIQSIRAKRQRIRILKETNQQQQMKLLFAYNKAENFRSSQISTLHSCAGRRVFYDMMFNSLRKRNPTNDCFHIWYKGSFGSINGLRLGSVSETFPPPPTPSSYSDVVVVSTLQVKVGSLSIDDTTESNTTASTVSSSLSPSTSSIASFEYDPFKVPWSETNAALGTVALLMVVLQEKPNSPIKYPNHEIIPMGSFSKISVIEGSSTTTHNLFSDDSFQIFGKRSFNTALKELLRCLSDAAEAVYQYDKSMILPYKIEMNREGEMVIGKLSIMYGPDGERWSKALKYFLANLKWLVAFSTKHLDR